MQRPALHACTRVLTAETRLSKPCRTAPLSPRSSPPPCDSSCRSYFAIAWLPTYFTYQFEFDTAAASSASATLFAAAAAGSITAGLGADVLVARGVPLSLVRKGAQAVAKRCETVKAHRA
jgi:hypothetical protein